MPASHSSRISLRSAIDQLTARRDLSEADARDAIGTLMRGEATPEETAALLTAWKEKGVTVDELTGAVRAMRAAAVPLTVRPGILVDTCGTGGDGLETFNISTVSAFVVAGAGVRVAKHGNRGVSSSCGSADLLEELQVNIDPGPVVVARCIEEVGLGFLFAPRFHPAMRHVAPVRKQLGFRTIFNLLGPLTNPAGATHQLVGVPGAELADLMVQVLQRLETRRALVVHGDEGLDEVSLTAPTKMLELTQGRVTSYTVTPEAFGLPRAMLPQLRGGDPGACARIARVVLADQPSPYRDAVLLNAGCALYVAEAAADIANGVSLARQALRSFKALEKYEALKALTNAA